MGLIGYINDEMQRRSKEIAIRKVNGAEASSILLLLSKDIFWTSMPAVCIGTLGPGIWELCGRTSFLKRLNFRYTIIS